jgi:hypothetical protein
MMVPDTMGGARESTAKGDVFRNFQIMSNELTTTIITCCPADTRYAHHATNFTYFNNQDISYFVGCDADTNIPNAWLCGDRNITNGFSPNRSIITVEAGQSAGWNKELHDRCGNVALAHGSVQQISNVELRSALKNTAGWTNRIALPE